MHSTKKKLHLFLFLISIGLVACQQQRMDLSNLPDGMDPSQVFNNRFSASDLFNIEDRGEEITLSASAGSQQRGIYQGYNPFDPFVQFSNAVRAWNPRVSLVTYVLFGRDGQSGGSQQCTRLKNIRFSSVKGLIHLRSSPGVTSPNVSFQSTRSFRVDGDSSGTSSGLGGVIIGVEGASNQHCYYPQASPWFGFDQFTPPNCGTQLIQSMDLRVTGQLQNCSGSGGTKNINIDLGPYLYPDVVAYGDDTIDGTSMYSPFAPSGGGYSMPYFDIPQGDYRITGRAIEFGSQNNWWY